MPPATALELILRISIAEVEQRRVGRPAGYADDLLSAGIAKDGHLLIGLSALQAVKRRHGVPDSTLPTEPLPPADWPPYVTALAAQRVAGEAGAGDTAERVVGPFGSDAWRHWFAEEAGVMEPQCLCQLWKARWNALYQYPKPETTLPDSGALK